MTPKEFFNKVAAMRDAQREYRNTRYPESHKKAKGLEAEIDKEIRRVRKIQAEQAREEALRAYGSLSPEEFTD